jgi:hypothetical protein
VVTGRGESADTRRVKGKFDDRVKGRRRSGRDGMYVCPYVCVIFYVCMYICVGVHIYTQTLIYIYMYMYDIYIYIYIYIYI